MQKFDENFARDAPVEEIAKQFEGSEVRKYGPHIEFDLRLEGPTNGKFRITGTVEQVKQSLKVILERFGPTKKALTG